MPYRYEIGSNSIFNPLFKQVKYAYFFRKIKILNPLYRRGSIFANFQRYFERPAKIVADQISDLQIYHQTYSI